MASQATSHGSFKIQGAQGPIEVPAGSYYFNTKDRCRRLMLNHLSSGARQVYACLELFTMGWQRELAVIQEKKGLRPANTRDIAEMTGLDLAYVRRSLDELEEEGLAERRAKNGKPLQKSNVEIYSWATPHAPKKEFRGRAGPQNIRWIPDSWKPLTAYAKRCRYELPEDLGDARDTLIAEGERLARVLEEAENAAARFLESVCAQSNSAAHKEVVERTEIYTEKEPPPPQPPPEPAARPEEEEEEPVVEPTETPTPRTSDLYQEFKQAYPQHRFDESKAKPLFRALPRPAQERAIKRLRDVYLVCERWLDEAGKWIPWAHKWLNEAQYDADPPPKWAKDQQRGRKELSSVDEVVAYMRRQREAKT